MNSSIGNSAEAAPPFVSFDFSLRAVHLGCIADRLFGLALLLGAAQALAQMMSVSLMSNIDRLLNSNNSAYSFRDAATQFVLGNHALGVQYLPEIGGGGFSLPSGCTTASRQTVPLRCDS